ncbi:DAPG hydrolase family protein [Klebsiella pneumoniae]|uniref:DAPG hydrolase family protein n=1 Tax=Klebsiella pneumoniae TaxID=573 RepID=UPI00203F8527|nr:2,4-diacetylphloroglucinol hydrolase [Klebsiella pneumoniae]USB65773.1 2,4-diacetylphloroglucinol hydrolase [Klebsiella pneumoniae]HBT4769504.1 2,4-diacetylphloroglucinol hydrolase [Klebsiella variicola subsp. variicola]HBT4923615.1 2,4-diacetylphloroglucinol hydrolase [Klebsiella pneumoniae]HCB1396544.1 2,4-diacetylphloroglucinol hydrolase [Klebsiella pneumoniae]
MTREFSRRSILKSVPGIAGGALLYQSFLGSVLAAEPAPVSLREGKKTATVEKTMVTYFQVPMQKRVKVNEKLIQSKPYARYFDSNLNVPVQMVRGLEAGPLAKEHILQPTEEGLKALLAELDRFPVSGYALVEEGPCAYAQSRHLFPGVTTKMFEWWFTWHPIESERYFLWFPHAHVHNSVADPKRLADTSLSYGERLYDNPNHITEYIGNMYLDSTIHFNRPESFGVPGDLLKKEGFTFNASGIITPFDDQKSPLVLMIHLGRDTPEGMEMVNRYWIGTHPSWDRFAKFPGGGKKSREVVHKMGLSNEALENLAYEMAVHDMTEFTTLGRFLPQIYEEFSNA